MFEADDYRVAILLLANMGLKVWRAVGLCAVPPGRNSTFSEYGSESAGTVMRRVKLLGVAILLLANMGLKAFFGVSITTLLNSRNSTFSEYGSESTKKWEQTTRWTCRNSTFSEYGSERKMNIADIRSYLVAILLLANMGLKVFPT